jgi:TPR repeat protein
VEYGTQIRAGNHPELVAKSLGITPEDEEEARTAHYFLPSLVASIAQRMQQEEKKYEDTMKESFLCFEKGIRLDPYNPELQFQIGTAYQLGLVVQEDCARAFDWFRRAAEQGHADAQYELCGFHDEEFCVPQQNNIQAAEWCRQAAEQGHNMAQFRMCNIYLLGDGVPQDRVEACFWHELFISNWDEKAVLKSRKEFPAKLSSDELANVRRRVAEWISSHRL